MKTISLPCGVKGYVLYEKDGLSCVQTNGVTAGPFSDIFLDKRDICEYDIRTKKFKEELVRNKLIIGNLFMPDFNLLSIEEHDILAKVAGDQHFAQRVDWCCAWLGVEGDFSYAWCVDSYGNVNYYSRDYSSVVAPAFISKTSELDKYREEKFESNESITGFLREFKMKENTI